MTLAKYPEMLQLGEYIKKLRGDDITSAKLASGIGVSKSFISDIENGNKMKPRIEDLEKIAKFFSDGDKNKSNFLYVQLLELAGYVKERNTAAHKTLPNNKKEVRPLSDLVKSLDVEASRPLEPNEFMAIYKDSSNNEISYRDTAKSEIDFFDLNRVINTEYQVNTKYETGISALGNSPLYYSGKKLTYKDREKISRILDAVFDIDRNSQE